MSRNENEPLQSNRGLSPKEKFRSIVDILRRTSPSDPSNNKSLKPKLVYIFELLENHLGKDNAKKIHEKWVQDELAPSSFSDFIEQLKSGNDDDKNRYLKHFLDQTVKYFSEDERENTRLDFRSDGLVYRGRDEAPYHTINNPDGVYTSSDGTIKKSANPDHAAGVIIDENIYAQHHITGVIQHTSLTGGSPAKIGLLFEVEKGKITEFINKSGHYRTSSESFRAEVLSLIERYPDHIHKDVKLIDNFRPCYFDPVLHSGSNYFIYKFGEELSGQFIESKRYNSIEDFRNAKLPYLFEINQEDMDLKIRTAINNSINSERTKLLPGETQAEYDISSIVDTSKQIIGIQQIINNSELAEGEKKELHDRLSHIFHLELESIAGNREIGESSKDAIKRFYGSTLNMVKDDFTRNQLKDKTLGLYQSSFCTYIPRGPEIGDSLEIVSASMALNKAQVEKIEESMRRSIEKMDQAGFKDLSNQFKKLMNLRHSKDENNGEFIPREIFETKRNNIIKQINSNPELNKFQPNEEDISYLHANIFRNSTKERGNSLDLLGAFSDQVESLRIENLKQINKMGGGFGQENQPLNYNTRLDIAYEEAEYMLTPKYLQELMERSLKNSNPTSNHVTILIPTQDHDSTDDSENLMTRVKAEFLSEKLNGLSRETIAPFTFKVDTIQVMTSLNYSKNDPIEALIKQPFFEDIGKVSNQNLIIFNEHDILGSSTSSLANFAKINNGNVICATNFASHQLESRSIRASQGLIQALETCVTDDKINADPINKGQSLDNLENLLIRFGMSISSLTNLEALKLCGLLASEKKLLLLDKKKVNPPYLQLIHNEMRNTQKLYVKRHPFTVRTLEAEINKRLSSNPRRYLSRVVNDHSAFSGEYRSQSHSASLVSEYHGK